MKGGDVWCVYKVSFPSGIFDSSFKLLLIFREGKKKMKKEDEVLQKLGAVRKSGIGRGEVCSFRGCDSKSAEILEEK